MPAVPACARSHARHGFQPAAPRPWQSPGPTPDLKMHCYLLVQVRSWTPSLWFLCRILSSPSWVAEIIRNLQARYVLRNDGMNPGRSGRYMSSCQVAAKLCSHEHGYALDDRTLHRYCRVLDDDMKIARANGRHFEVDQKQPKLSALDCRRPAPFNNDRSRHSHGCIRRCPPYGTRLA